MFWFFNTRAAFHGYWCYFISVKGSSLIHLSTLKRATSHGSWKKAFRLHPKKLWVLSMFYETICDFRKPFKRFKRMYRIIVCGTYRRFVVSRLLLCTIAIVRCRFENPNVNRGRGFFVLRSGVIRRETAPATGYSTRRRRRRCAWAKTIFTAPTQHWPCRNRKRETYIYRSSNINKRYY